MHTSPPFRRSAAACAAVAALLLGACSDAGDRLTEEGIERVIENETGEDIDFDFDNDGGFTFESDEGSIRIGDDGTFIIEGEDGEVISGESNDGGFTVTDGDGTAVFNVDQDGDGGFSAQSDDGSFASGQGIPSAWPTAVPRPEGLTEVFGSVLSSDDGMFISVNGMAPGDPFVYFEGYVGTLMATGYNQASYFEGDGFRQGTYDGPMYDVTVLADETSSNIGVTIMEMQS